MTTIRKANILDISAIKALNEQCLSENYSLSWWHMFYFNGTILVAEESSCFGKKIIGYIVALVIPEYLTLSDLTNEFIKENNFNKFYMISSFGVLKKSRNQGIGQLLLEKLLLVVTDHPKILNVRISNDGAIHLYKKNGFVCYKQIDENYYKDPSEDAFLMFCK